jgi:toxin ParE1/3/4
VDKAERCIRSEAGDLVADRFIREVVAKVRSLRNLPIRQRLRRELAAELRAVSVGNYLVFYRVDGDLVRIVRVLHSSRNITAKLFPRDARKA